MVNFTPEYFKSIGSNICDVSVVVMYTQAERQLQYTNSYKWLSLETIAYIEAVLQDNNNMLYSKSKCKGC